jgi:ADP-dependent NAD(P)H-hydrate dehydratase
VSVASDAVAVTTALLRSWPLPSPDGGKEGRGRVLVVGGSAETPGAVLLAAEASLRAGAGKLQVATGRSVATALGVAIPEALVRGVPETSSGGFAVEGADAVLELARSCDAVLIGPGLVDLEASRSFVARLLPELDCAVLLDALGAAIVTDDPSCLQRFEGRALLTPNQTELALMLGIGDARVRKDPAAAGAELAGRTGAVVAVGGPVLTIVAPDGRVWSDEAGGPGLGVSGSGDVRAGIVIGLAARGAPVDQAAVWGSHLHSRAGARLAAAVGQVGYLARDIAAEVPRALAEIAG